MYKLYTAIRNSIMMRVNSRVHAHGGEWTQRHQSNCPISAVASRDYSMAKQLLKLASSWLSQDGHLANFLSKLSTCPRITAL